MIAPPTKSPPDFAKWMLGLHQTPDASIGGEGRKEQQAHARRQYDVDSSMNASDKRQHWDKFFSSCAQNLSCADAA
jgi:hypothetical protein